MNQDKYSRLTKTLSQCGISNSESLVNDFKQFMKYQKLNKDIDLMIDEAHHKKISEEEFKSMIDEQKQIMKDLSLRNLEFKKLPSSVHKPKLDIMSNNVINNSLVKNIKIFNISEINNFEIHGDRYYFYGPNKEKIKKLKLENGNIVSIDSMTNSQLEELSEEVSENLEEDTLNNSLHKNIKPVKKPVKKTLKKPVKKTLIKPVKKTLKKPVKKTLKREKKNQYWYHKIPEHSIKNITKINKNKKKLNKKKLKKK